MTCAGTVAAGSDSRALRCAADHGSAAYRCRVDRAEHATGQRPVAPRFPVVAALVALLLLVVGLAVMIAGQRMIEQEDNPSRQYVDGRYWTIDPGQCIALGAETKGACAALDSQRSAELAREHQNNVTIRAVGVVLLLSGAGLLVGTFVVSRREAERLLM